MNSLDYENSDLRSKVKDLERRHAKFMREIEEVQRMATDVNVNAASQLEIMASALRQEQNLTREERKKNQVLQVKLQEIQRSISVRDDTVHQLQSKLVSTSSSCLLIINGDRLFVFLNTAVCSSLLWIAQTFL